MGHLSTIDDFGHQAPIQCHFPESVALVLRAAAMQAVQSADSQSRRRRVARRHHRVRHAPKLRRRANREIRAHIFDVRDARSTASHCAICRLSPTTLRKDEATLHSEPHARLGQRRRLPTASTTAARACPASRVVAVGVRPLHLPAMKQVVPRSMRGCASACAPRSVMNGLRGSGQAAIAVVTCTNGSL